MHHVKREGRSPISKKEPKAKPKEKKEAEGQSSAPTPSTASSGGSPSVGVGLNWKKWLGCTILTVLIANISGGLFLCLRAQYWGTIFEAAEWGYIERIETLKQQGESLAQHRADDGNTLLHVARDPQTIIYLAENGASVEARNLAGYTPLGHLLANRSDEWGNFDGMRSLLSVGASPEGAVDRASGKNALMLLWSTWKTVSKYRYNNTELLLEYGATPVHQDDLGDTVYHSFARYLPATAPSLSSMALSSLDAMANAALAKATSPRISQRAGADPTIKLQNKKGFTPLMELAFTSSPFSSSMPTVMELVKRWSSVEVLELKDVDEGSAICYAAFKGLEQPLVYMLDLIKNEKLSLAATISRFMPHVMSCAMLSPAHELNFESGGVIDILVKVGIPVIPHHLQIFEQVWEGVEAPIDATTTVWSPLELKLMSECSRYQQYFKPEKTLLTTSKNKLRSLMNADTYQAASVYNTKPPSANASPPAQTH